LSISEMCVTDLAATIGLNQTTLSHQLRLMRSIGAVSVRREGKIIYYGIKDELINDIIFKGMDFLSK
ncbi:MAG: metalloregulator ArsR/SmtB family transcription factor, partial [Clostridia bacterium]|nr:metalloregulator ArsR/SmtB family transcription factor [Clostridia bacterium]